MSPIVLSSVDMACHYSVALQVASATIVAKRLYDCHHGQIHYWMNVHLILKCLLGATGSAV